MKSLVSLLEHLLADAGRRCNAPFRRDFLTISRRVECEGDSFLTITLPNLGQVFERALDQGRLDPCSLNGLFRKKDSRKTTCLPAFLQGFMSQVFDSTGRLLDNPSSDCILAIRQICYIVKKVNRPCKQARLTNAELAFIKCESEVNNSPRGDLWSAYRSVCKIVMSSICSDTMYEELVPRHGPGTTCEKITGNSKYSHKQWHSRLDRVFPYTEFGVGSLRNLFHTDYTLPDFSEPKDEQPVRVVFVPKTMKSPRVIAIEPVCMQYTQQALMQWMVPSIERGFYTRGRVNFRSQSVNQSLAQEASRTGKYATIDMSEASDRVSMAHAKALYSIDRTLWSLVVACRSMRASLPNGITIPLRKFASMGSALCFPTEAMVFYCAIVASRILRAKAKVRGQTVFSFGRDVYVFGDDLIVPSDEALAVCADLEALGLKVNKHKSFWTGKFRESCGMDYYDNVKVTPVYLRRDFPSSRSDSNGIISLVATSNQLFEAGYYRTSLFIKEKIEDLLGSLPEVPRESPAIGWTFYSAKVPPARWNKHLQRLEHRCLVATPRKRKDPLEGDSALAKCWSLIGLKSVDERHLLESTGIGHLALKSRWVYLRKTG